MPKLGESHSAKRKTNNHGPEFLEGLARGIKVLTAFGRDRPKTTLADLAKVLGFPRATVRRSLITLEALGYVESDERQFWLTPKVLELANSFLLSNPLNTLFQPVCDKLAKEFDIGVSIATRDQDEVVFIVRAYPDHSFSGQRSAVGARLPAYCTAIGRMLLAGLDNGELTEYLKNITPKQLTPMTKVSKRAIREEIELARTNGWAMASQEATLGYRSLAVPIRRYDGAIVASLSCNGRVEVVTEKVMKNEFLPRLLEESKKLIVPSSA